MTATMLAMVVRERRERMNYPFNQDGNFNPRIDADRRVLQRLRTPGAGRLLTFRFHEKYGKYSPRAGMRMKTAALEMAWDMCGHSGKDVILDLGCGESPDRLIANTWGDATAFGLDLFPPNRAPRAGFIQGDAIGLPILDASIDTIICTAVLDLIKPEARAQFYSECRRVLKKEVGIFIITPFELHNGYGFRWLEEHQQILEAACLLGAGFHFISRHKRSPTTVMYGVCEGSPCDICDGK